ncbi:phage holin family protein [Avrilella dinanensis]|uniref:phage holin family protein n=1 Tax=Avrilella dinanensis TaxID=2008672 RepID=UPI002409CAF8|nr:phage holin family protein [Avrilella dinanensis]
MRFIINLLITALIVFGLAHLLPGVSVDSYITSLWVVVALVLLNLIVKPILQILTFPITILTLGLFLFVINAVIIMLCDYFVGGFNVENFWYALLFSLVLSLVESVIGGMLTE